MEREWKGERWKERVEDREEQGREENETERGIVRKKAIGREVMEEDGKRKGRRTSDKARRRMKERELKPPF